MIATHRRREMPQTLAELVAKYPKVRVETLDVTDLEQAKALAAKLADVPIDILVNNAGVYNDRSGCASGDDGMPGQLPDAKLRPAGFRAARHDHGREHQRAVDRVADVYPNVKASTLKKIVAVSSSNGTITGELPTRGRARCSIA